MSVVLFVPHAFISTMPKSGHKGVFLRAGKKRLPIRELFGGSVYDLFAGLTSSVEVLAIIKETQERLYAELDTQVGVLLDQQAAGKVVPLSPRVAALTGATTGRLVA